MPGYSKREAAEEMTLEDYIKSQLVNGKKKFLVLKNIYSDISNGKIKLIDPAPPKSFEEYIVRLDYSSWFWIVTGVTIITTIVILVNLPYLIYARYVLGAVYILFLVGYVTIEAIYPGEKKFSSIEEFMLCIILSIALVTLFGFIINAVTGTLSPAIVVTTLNAYVWLASFYSLYMKYKLFSRNKTIK